jgi:hypothetical protein
MEYSENAAYRNGTSPIYCCQTMRPLAKDLSPPAEDRRLEVTITLQRGTKVSVTHMFNSSVITRFVLPPVVMASRVLIAPRRDKRSPVWCANSRSSSTILE